MGRWVEGLGCGGGGDGGGSSRWLHAVLQAQSRGAERLRLCQTLLRQAAARSRRPPNPHAPTVLSSTPAATEAQVKNRRSLVTLHVKASAVLRGDTHWKQTTGARLDVCFLPLVISPFWSDTVTDLHRLQLSLGLRLT